MKKSILLLGFAALCLNAPADDLVGFNYGDALYPTGKEWESPEDLALNKEQPHAWFFSFHDTESARRVLPENSDYFEDHDLRCRNSKCICNHENVKPLFHTTEDGTVRCVYCDSKITQ